MFVKLQPDIILSYHLFRDDIVKIKSLDEAVEFWELHDSADYWEDMEEVEFEVELYKNLLHPRLIVLSYRPEHCPRCQHDFNDIIVEYVVSDDGRLLVIRDVPALPKG